MGEVSTDLTEGTRFLLLGDIPATNHDSRAEPGTRRDFDCIRSDLSYFTSVVDQPALEAHIGENRYQCVRVHLDTRLPRSCRGRGLVATLGAGA